jgi:hypothetical protein
VIGVLSFFQLDTHIINRHLHQHGYRFFDFSNLWSRLKRTKGKCNDCRLSTSYIGPLSEERLMESTCHYRLRFFVVRQDVTTDLNAMVVAVCDPAKRMSRQHRRTCHRQPHSRTSPAPYLYRKYNTIYILNKF